MNRIYAVLDTCVLLPAPIYNTLLFIAGHFVYQPIWTDLILEELARNLLTADSPRRSRTPEQVERRLRAMAEAFEPAANLDRLSIDYRSYIDQMPNHPKDRHVLAAAVAADADYLVTENTRDFRVATPIIDPLSIVTADEFLIELLDNSLWHQVNTLSALYKQIRPPGRFLEIEDLLDTLVRHNRTTQFAARVREIRSALLGLDPQLDNAIVNGWRISEQMISGYGMGHQ